MNLETMCIQCNFSYEIISYIINVIISPYLNNSFCSSFLFFLFLLGVSSWILFTNMLDSTNSDLDISKIKLVAFWMNNKLGNYSLYMCGIQVWIIDWCHKYMCTKEVKCEPKSPEIILTPRGCTITGSKPSTGVIHWRTDTHKLEENKYPK